MAALVVLSCPIDGLEIDLSFLGEFGDMLAGFSVGGQNSFWTDASVVCPNGHHWGVNFKVEYTREA